jgi:hypothetical protein
MTAVKERRKYMNRKTRIALDMLQDHRWGWLTTEETTLDGRSKKTQTLYVNITTARALERRGLGVITYAAITYAIAREIQDV